jgi:hypothetical protein
MSGAMGFEYAVDRPLLVASAATALWANLCSDKKAPCRTLGLTKRVSIERHLAPLSFVHPLQTLSVGRCETFSISHWVEHIKPYRRRTRLTSSKAGAPSN